MDKPDISPQDPRVIFAAERTMLAWTRTGIAMIGFGFVVARFGLFLRSFDEGQYGRGGSLPFGAALALVGALATLYGTILYRRRLAKLERGEPIAPRDAAGAGWVGFLTALVGGGLVLYLALAAH